MSVETVVETVGSSVAGSIVAPHIVAGEAPPTVAPAVFVRTSCPFASTVASRPFRASGNCSTSGDVGGARTTKLCSKPSGRA